MDFLDSWIEATGEALRRVDVEIEERALLDRRELQPALRERHLPVHLELAAEAFVGGQLADHLLYAALGHRLHSSCAGPVSHRACQAGGKREVCRQGAVAERFTNERPWDDRCRAGV